MVNKIPSAAKSKQRLKSKFNEAVDLMEAMDATEKNLQHIRQEFADEFERPNSNLQFDKNTATTDELKAIEEVVIWKKPVSNFNHQSIFPGHSTKENSVVGNQKGPIKNQDTWMNFIQNLRFIAPDKVDLSFVKTPECPDLGINLFDEVASAISRHGELFCLCDENSYLVDVDLPKDVESSTPSKVLISFTVPVLSPNLKLEKIKETQDRKLQVLKALYRIKCREEKKGLEINLYHNKPTLEASNRVGIMFKEQITLNIAEKKPVVKNESNPKSKKDHNKLVIGEI